MVSVIYIWKHLILTSVLLSVFPQFSAHMVTCIAEMFCYMQIYIGFVYHHAGLEPRANQMW